jgi:hypothetical protein
VFANRGFRESYYSTLMPSKCVHDALVYRSLRTLYSICFWNFHVQTCHLWQSLLMLPVHLFRSISTDCVGKWRLRVLSFMTKPCKCVGDVLEKIRSLRTLSSNCFLNFYVQSCHHWQSLPTLLVHFISFNFEG